MAPFRLTGSEAEKWFKNFANCMEVGSQVNASLAQVVSLLEAELPKRFTESRAYAMLKYPNSHEWINSVLYNQEKPSISLEQQNDFRDHLLDLTASTDTIIVLPDQTGNSIKIAVDITTNPQQEKNKIDKINGRPDKKDSGQENRNKNISKVRKALGIDKHLVLTLDATRSNLPSYDTLLSELKAFAESPSVTGSLNLRNLPPEQTIGGAYQQLAALHPIDNDHQRLTAIASQSIANGDHPHFTAQILLNDPASLKLDSFDKARGLVAKYASQALERTPHYQIAAAVQHILKQQGKRVEGGTMLDAGKRILTQTDAGYSIYDKENQALLFRSDKLKAKVFKLDPTESNRYLKYFNANVKNKQTTRQGRGFTL